MGRKHANPLTNPLHYAAKQGNMGPLVRGATAERAMPSYDYGEFNWGTMSANKLTRT